MSYVYAPKGIVEKYPYSIVQLRKDNPDTSFPTNPSKEMLAEWGVFPCEVLPPPEHDRLTETVYRQPPSQTEQGDWVVAWTVEQLPTEDAAERVRDERDRLLAASDWTQVADAPVDQAAWAAYRQALRDIPQQAGFPDAVTWPTEPE